VGTYVRGAAGVSVGSRRIVWVVAGLCIGVLALLVVVLTVSAIDQQSRANRLRQVGVPVEVTVTGCMGRASGTGITTTGYTCRGRFVLSGARHEAVIGGSSALRAPGDTLRVVADPLDPTAVATVQSVARPGSSWTAFIAPASLLVALLAAGAIAWWQLPRLRR